MIPFVKLSKWVVKLKFESASTIQKGKIALKRSAKILHPRKIMIKQAKTLKIKLMIWFCVKAEVSEQIPRKEPAIRMLPM